AVATADATLQNPSCRGAVKRCAAKSTCGRPGSVTCIRTDTGGRTKCQVKRDPGLCIAPSGGTACVGAGTSCCDASSTGWGPPASWGGAGYQTGGGTCPAGQVCGRRGGADACTCNPADQCQSFGLACGGTCPAGQVCGQVGSAYVCGCHPAEQCEGSAPS